MQNFSTYLTICTLFLLSCSSVKYTFRDGLPEYKTELTYEFPYERVWNATYNVIAANADIEVADENDGIIKTGWNYDVSDVNVAEYQVNEETKYKPLRLRYRYTVSLKKKMEGILVKINSTQDYEELNPEGIDIPSNSWVSTKSSTAREHKLLEEIKTEIRK